MAFGVEQVDEPVARPRVVVFLSGGFSTRP